MKRLTILPLAALALASCNQKSVSLTNATPEEVAKASKENGPKLSPGRWETKVEILDISMPGMPPGFAEKMTEQMKSAASTVASCIKPEDVDKPNTELFSGQKGSGCTFGKYEMSNGTIDAEMTCPGKGASGTMTMKMKGTFQPDAVTVENEADVSGGPGGKGMHEKVRVTAHRTGECNGSEKGA